MISLMILCSLFLIWILGFWFISITYDLGWSWNGFFDSCILDIRMSTKDYLSIAMWPLILMCGMLYIPIRVLIWILIDIPKLVVKSVLGGEG